MNLSSHREILKVKDLKLYYDNLVIVEGVSFSLFAGEVLSLIGPSGCGKTSMIKAIAGLIPFEGKIELKEKGLGYMPQKGVLFEWMRLKDNLALPLLLKGKPRREAYKSFEKLLEEFGLSGFEDYYPFQLSGGMAQRASLLRTILTGAKLLLLDEPFASLDAITRRRLQIWLRRIFKRLNLSSLLVTHDLQEAIFLSDRILVLGDFPTRIVKEVRIQLQGDRNALTFSNDDFKLLEKELLQALELSS